MIPFISSLPLIGNCFKSEEYPKSLKQPFQIKVTTIRERGILLKKVIGVALVLLVLCGTCILMAPKETPNAGRVTTNNNCNQIPCYLRPYSNHLNLKIHPDSIKPITSLPSHFHPKKMYGENGRICVISDKKPVFEECYKVNAFQQALFFIEKEVMNSPDFFEKDAGMIVESIKKTNAFITKYTSDSPGKLRNQMALLVEVKTEITRKGLKKAFYRQGGTPQDIRTFHSLYDKLEKYDLLDHAIKYLNADELRVLKIVGYLPCLPKEIDCKLNNLAHQIKELALQVTNQETDAIPAAAFVHQELVKIDPFMHGNKETARMWMFVMLQLGGFEAITMHEIDYEFEVIKDLKSPGTFAPYLKQAIEWNRKQDK